MGERLTKQDLRTRVENLNRRMEAAGSMWRYEVGWRYDYTALDRVHAKEGYQHDVVRVGTKSQIGEFLHAKARGADNADKSRGCRQGHEPGLTPNVTTTRGGHLRVAFSFLGSRILEGVYSGWPLSFASVARFLDTWRMVV